MLRSVLLAYHLHSVKCDDSELKHNLTLQILVDSHLEVREGPENGNLKKTYFRTYMI